jgi:hypothetical protein
LKTDAEDDRIIAEIYVQKIMAKLAKDKKGKKIIHVSIHCGSTTILTEWLSG